VDIAQSRGTTAPNPSWNGAAPALQRPSGRAACRALAGEAGLPRRDRQGHGGASRHRRIWPEGW